MFFSGITAAILQIGLNNAGEQVMPYRIYKRSNSPYYQAYISVKVDGQARQIRLSTHEAIRDKAIEIARAAEADLLAVNGKSDITIDQAFGEYYDKVAVNHSRPKFTFYTLRKLSDFLGPQKAFASLNAADINDFIYAMTAKGQASGTINRNLVVLSGVINTCDKKWKWRAPAVRPLEFRLREPDGRIGLIDGAVRASIYKHAADHLRLAIRIAHYTGMRRGNILGLKWSDIDFARNAITIKVKDANTSSGRYHTVFMPERLVRVLNSTMRTCDYVVSYKGLPVKDLKTAWRAACKRAGIPAGEYTFHDLRHGSATEVVRKTQSLFAAQVHLGHKNPKMTQRYGKFLDRDRLEIAKAVFD